MNALLYVDYCGCKMVLVNSFASVLLSISSHMSLLQYCNFTMMQMFYIIRRLVDNHTGRF